MVTVWLEETILSYQLMCHKSRYKKRFIHFIIRQNQAAAATRSNRLRRSSYGVTATTNNDTIGRYFYGLFHVFYVRPLRIKCRPILSHHTIYLGYFFRPFSNPNLKLNWIGLVELRKTILSIPKYTQETSTHLSSAQVVQGT